MQRAPRAMSTLMRSCMTQWSWSPRRVTAAFWLRYVHSSPSISLTSSTSFSALFGCLGLSVSYPLSCLHRHVFIPPWALVSPSVKQEVMRLQ